MIDCALITGAGSGIGQAVALRLAAKGISLVLVGRWRSVEKTRQMILRQGGEAETFTCDLEHSAEILPALTQVVTARPTRHWGVILAASMLDPLGEHSCSSDYERVFRVNVTGNLAALECCLPTMKKTGFGRVVFFAGGGAAYAYPAFPGYALSKVSTVRLVENLAAVHPASSGLSFVCLAPGAVATPMLSRVLAAGGEVKTKTSIDEPVNFVETYCSSVSAALTGRYVHVRDDWQAVLDGTKLLTPDQFLLRRTP